ncbi:MAG: ATP-binding cassette domain-containing protein [Pseudomonadales bacterium]|nr:ATP-binding cassette domain-containing protein [Pseudomonadales bacterium]
MIKFSSVSKYFPPDTFAISDISFEVEPGELVLLTGPSGSGKTTIMRLLTREYIATKGDVIFADIDLNKVKNSKVHEIRRKIGVIFQDYLLLPELNIWENIALPLSIIGKPQAEIEQRVTDLLTLVSLTDKAFLFPKQLSGGEAQRISIARALSTAPEIVFADEPTGNLDRETSLEIGKLIRKINSFGTTVIFATHDHDIMDLLKDIRHIELDKGKIVRDSKIARSTQSEASTDKNEITTNNDKKDKDDKKSKEEIKEATKEEIKNNKNSEMNKENSKKSAKKSKKIKPKEEK